MYDRRTGPPAAALEAFGESGFSTATMKEIAMRAEIALLDFGFELLKSIHPLLRGMFSEAARQDHFRTQPAGKSVRT